MKPSKTVNWSSRAYGRSLTDVTSTETVPTVHSDELSQIEYWNVSLPK